MFAALPRSLSNRRRTLGLLALGAWLGAGCALWQSARFVPRETLHFPILKTEAIRCCSSDGLHFVAVEPNDGPSTVLDAHSKERGAELEGMADARDLMSFTADNRRLLAGDKEGVTLWDADSGRVLLQVERGHWLGFTACSPDGKTLAAIHPERRNPATRAVLEIGNLALWDIASGKQRALLPCKNARNVVFSPDGKLVGAANGEGAVWYDPDTARQCGAVQFPRVSGDGNLAFSPDHRILATCSRLGDVYFWSTETGERLASYMDAEKGRENIFFSPDGSTVAVGYFWYDPRAAWLTGWVGKTWAERVFSPPIRCGTVFLDSKTGELKARLPGYYGRAFPDDHTFITYVAQVWNTVDVWDVPPRRAFPPVLAWSLLAPALALSTAYWRKRRAASKPPGAYSVAPKTGP
jgi:WD40 repeat protein